MLPKEYPEQLCAVLARTGLSATLVQDVQTAFEHLQSYASAFLLVDIDLDGAIPFIEKVMTTFYNPPPYILAAGRYPCSTACAEILDLGVDTCLEKPLDAEEVRAMINAVLRRSERLAYPKPLRSAPHIERGGLVIDPLRRNVIMDGKPVALTVKEFEILNFLASYPDIVFTKSQIYERIWGEDYKYTTTSISDHISSLRKKLGLDPKEGRYIQTVFGSGYRFVTPK